MIDLTNISANEALNIVVNHLEVCADSQPYELSADKVRSRGYGCEVKGDGIYFAVDRHHPILGAIYYPGLPMASYIEVKYIYRFDPISKEIKEVGGGQLMKMSGLENAAYKIVYSPDGERYRISNDTEDLFTLHTALGNRYKVKSLKEALAYAEEEIRDMYWEFYLDALSDFLSSTEIDKLREEIKIGLIKVFTTTVTEEITEAWEESYSEN